MIEALLQEHGGELLRALTNQGGLDAGQAERLLPPALGGIQDALAGGGLDLSSLLGGGGGGAVSTLLSELDVGRIASQADVEESQARGGLAALIPVVVSLLGDKAGGAEGLIAMLGGSTGSAGALGALGGMAGKLFGK